MDENSYYEIVYGYQMGIVKTDWPTTDYGALTDILIDGLEEEGVGEPYLLPLDKAEEEYNEDEYVVGGNHGLALIHNGNFDIRPISKNDAERYSTNDHIKIYSESKDYSSKSIVESLLQGKSVRDLLLKENYGGGQSLNLEPGDAIQVGNDKATISKILFQDVFVADDDSHLKSAADVEFEDENGNYRHWQSWSDGGTLTTVDGKIYQFEVE